MAHEQAMKREQTGTVPPGGESSGTASSAGESNIRTQELYRMAAFRIRETANRIATLANSARDETMRRALVATCERLLEEERRLLELSRS